jgi:hypothetical protein
MIPKGIPPLIKIKADAAAFYNPQRMFIAQ